MTIQPATEKSITRACELIRDGGLVAFPTETVYGLGADATNEMAVARVFEAKARPHFNPLIIHVPDFETAADFAVLNKLASALARTFWPGPLTIILPKKPATDISELASAGLDTIAIRCPDHPVALSLLRAFGRPIVAPSANRSGHLSPTEAMHVDEDLGDKVALILDGGPTALGIESTVITLEPQPRILRPGVIGRAEIEQIIGPLPGEISGPSSTSDKIVSPGQLQSHYAPNAGLRLNADRPGPGEAFLAFGPDIPDYKTPMFNLSPNGDLKQAAANLFSALRLLDKSGCSKIAVMAIPDKGLGEAINDRLRRASAPRKL